MAQVEARPNESVDSLLKRFKVAVSKDGVFAELKRRASFQSPTQKRREKHQKHLSRQRKTLLRIGDIGAARDEARANGKTGGEYTTMRRATTIKYNRMAA